MGNLIIGVLAGLTVDISGISQLQIPTKPVGNVLNSSKNE